MDVATNHPYRPTGHVLHDLEAAALQAVLTHIRLTADASPQRAVDAAGRIDLTVCGSLDYVIDAQKRHVVAAPASPRHGAALRGLRSPWFGQIPPVEDNIDLLTPLRRSPWLRSLLARPGWFGFMTAGAGGHSLPLFLSERQLQGAGERIIARAHKKLVRESGFMAMRLRLRESLAAEIGPQLLGLALRSRLAPKRLSLNARHLNLVCEHRAAYERMDRENPLLLTALTAWLGSRAPAARAELAQTDDLLPLMRRDLLDSGLQPAAWRRLCREGLDALLPRPCRFHAWEGLETILMALQTAAWPATPSPRALAALTDCADLPIEFHSGGDPASGWFWRLVCNGLAFARPGERGEILRSIPRWAWLVRRCGLAPDANQLRQGLAWFEPWAARQSCALTLDARRSWFPWLRDAPARQEGGFRTEALLSEHDLVTTAHALRNCADQYVPGSRAGTHLLVRLTDGRTSRPKGLAMLTRTDGRWRLAQLAGPCNLPASAAMRHAAVGLAAWVNYHSSRSTNTPPRLAADRPPEDAPKPMPLTLSQLERHLFKAAVAAECRRGCVRT